MADFPLYGDGQRLVPGTITSAAAGVGVALTPGANSKSSWVEIMSNTASARSANGFVLGINRTANSSWDALYDIGIGGAGSETVIVANLAQCAGADGLGAEAIFFPIYLPALTRVAVRGQAGTSSVTTAFMIHAIHGGSSFDTGLTGATGLGVNTSDSGSTGLTAGTSSEGSWVEIISSTTRNYKGLMIRGSSRNSVIAGANLLVDVAIGAAASEVSILSDIQMKTSGSVSSTGYIPIHIPAGVRLAVRAQGSAARDFDLSILGVY